MDSVVTSSTGFYDFGGLTNGTFGLKVKSAAPSGQWQTWGGVNNTDYMLVAKHAAGLQLLPVDPPVERIAASTKAPHPLINTADADAIKKAATFGWGNPAYFDIPKWVFSGLDQATRIDTFALACSDVTREIRGLCAGDVNGTYIPVSGFKMAAPGLQLVNTGTLPVTKEITFPVNVSLDQQNLGALTLLLNFDPSLIEIKNVEMPENGGTEPWFEVQGSKSNVAGTINTLQIGWMSLDPVQISRDLPVLLIHARITDPASRTLDPASRIRFSLDENPVSELADANGNVLSGAKLFVADAGYGIQNSGNETVMVYPNPASEMLNVSYQLNNDGVVTAWLQNMQSGVDATFNFGNQPAGWHSQKIDLPEIPTGVYFLKIQIADNTYIRKVVIRK